MENQYILQLNDGFWTCLCGNTPDASGFYTCNETGDQVEPTAATWTTNWYVCFQCGRVIDQDTLQVIKQVDPDMIVQIL